MSQRLARNELLVLFYLWHCLCRCDFVTLQCHGAILAAGFEGEHPRAQARGSTGGVCVCAVQMWDSAAPSEAVGKDIHPAVLQ